MIKISELQALQRVVSASSALEKEFTDSGDAYDRLCRDANSTDTAGRIVIAFAGYVVGSSAFRGSRCFDNCFENGDGDLVTAKLARRADLDPVLYAAIAADFGGQFPDKWRKPISDRNAQLVALRAASPMRPVAGRTADIDGLALFDHARQPSLF